MTQPPAPPMPVQMLDYGTPPPAGRPGLLTTVGILSIVFSVFYGLSALGTVVSTSMYYTMSQKMSAFSAASPTLPPTVPTGVSGPMSGPATTATPAPGDEMTEADQETLLAALDQTRGLDPADQAAVGRLLDQIGWKVAGHPPGGAATPEALERLISQSGETFDGGTFYGLPGGQLEVADGRAIFTAADKSVTISGAGVTATTRPAVAAPGVAVPMPMPMPFNFNISAGAITLSMVDAAIRFGLAVWLLVAGIKVLSNSPAGRRWHLWWAWVKLPLLLLSAAAAWWITNSMFNGIFNKVPTGPRTPPPMTALGSYVALMYVAFYAVIAAIYPVTVLILMNLNTARVFYTGELQNTPTDPA